MASGNRAAPDRNRWVWVARPEYYLDEFGSDSPSLTPGQSYHPGDWWTCHKDTKAGDLVLLYRSREKKDIAYLIEARSDAYALRDQAARELGWDYGCDYEVIEKFATPLPLAEMRKDPVLRDWQAVKVAFVMSAFAVPDDVWSHLLDRLSSNPPEIERRVRKVEREFSLEREIQDNLASDPSLFSRRGSDLSSVRVNIDVSTVGELTLFILKGNSPASVT